ncbi:MAG: amidohydrolase [Planctomycetota bacterium]|nr:MAG: amidohydrolase [Planctomycetota bacterium]
MFGHLGQIDPPVQQVIDGALRQAVERIGETVLAARRHLHAHPEPSGEETETTRFLADRLRRAGLPVRLLTRGSGLWTDCELGPVTETTPRIALRADIDALRIQDEKEVPYRSQYAGLAHSCGHDAHAAIVLGTALVARQLPAAAHQWQGPPVRLRFLFQPAEESCEGARWMIEQGALEGVDAILGVHVDPERTAGTVGIRYGVLTAYCDELDVLIDGRGGHAARPHHTIDPIAAAVQLVGAWYQLVPRSIDSREPHVLTIGKIAGGSAPNVIPQCVELRGSLRTVSDAARVRLKRRIEQIAQGVADATGARIHVRFLNPLPAVVNAPLPTAALHYASVTVLGADQVEILEAPSMGGEDFSLYLSHVPGAMLRLGCARPGIPDWPLLHSPLFDIDESALPIGVRILLSAALVLAGNLTHGAPSR